LVVALRRWQETVAKIMLQMIDMAETECVAQITVALEDMGAHPLAVEAKAFLVLMGGPASTKQCDELARCAVKAHRSILQPYLIRTSPSTPKGYFGDVAT
jgi:hypothetical protein